MCDMIKRKKTSHANSIFFIILGLLIAWQLIHVARILVDSAFIETYLLSMVIFIIAVIATFIYFLTIFLKRDPLMMDIIIVFPILAISIFYLYTANWLFIQLKPMRVPLFFTESFFYYLASLITLVFYTIKTVAVVLSWKPHKEIARRMNKLIAVVSLSTAVIILFDLVLHPFLIKIPLAAPIVGIIFAGYYFMERNHKIIRSNKEYVKRINEYL